SSRSIVDHGLSLLLFVGMTAEFLMVKQAASGTFFLLLVVSFVDVAGGFTMTIRSVQHDGAIEDVVSAADPEIFVAEPEIALAAPAESVPAAAAASAPITKVESLRVESVKV